MNTCPIATFLLIFAPLSAVAEDTPATSQEAAIRTAVSSYVEAFNKHDASALAAFWSPDAVYTNRTTGEQFVGREAMEKEFAAIFSEQQSLRLEATTESVQFISPNVAVEHGTARILRGESEPEETTYTAIYMKLNGKWLLDRITEDTIQVNPRQEKLKALEWLIGEWIDQASGDSIRVESNWARNNNYITRAYTVSSDGEVHASGLQIIGWDPKQQAIRSWLFDSEGGFVSGVWTQKKDHWYVQSVATLADGGGGSFTSVFRLIDANSYGWKKINQILDGEILPNLDEVVIARQQQQVATQDSSN